MGTQKQFLVIKNGKGDFSKQWLLFDISFDGDRHPSPRRHIEYNGRLNIEYELTATLLEKYNKKKSRHQ